MPTLYRLDAAARDVAQRFGAVQGRDPWDGGTVSPGRFAPVVTAGREAVAGPRPASGAPRRLVPRLWGVPPPRSFGEAPAQGILTVRNPDSPFWIGNLRNSEFRCLVPATAFMVWGRPSPSDGKRRTPSITGAAPRHPESRKSRAVRRPVHAVVRRRGRMWADQSA